MRIRTVKATDILKVIVLLLTLEWMLFIFYLSSETADESTALSDRIAEAIYRIVIPDFEELNPEERSIYLEAAAAPGEELSSRVVVDGTGGSFVLGSYPVDVP